MKRKIITQLSGGLGNQMFMYAAARAIALRMNADLYLDCKHGFKNDRLYRRNFALNHLDIKFKEAPPPASIRISWRTLYSPNKQAFKKTFALFEYPLYSRTFFFCSGASCQSPFFRLLYRRVLAIGKIF